MQPHGAEDNPYQRFLRELDERHFQQFPLSKKDLELKQELYSNGIFDDGLFAYHPSDNCYSDSSGDPSCSHPNSLPLSASFLGSSPLAAAPNYAPGHFDHGPPNLSVPQGWLQSPSHAQPQLVANRLQAGPANLLTPPTQSVGISATPFQSSSLVPATNPFEDGRRSQAQRMQLQYPSVPTVPSNGPGPQKRAPQSPSYHQSNSSSLSGWAEPSPMRSLNDPDAGYRQYQLDFMTVPSNTSPDDPSAIPTSPQYYLDQHRPSSSNQALQLRQSPGLGTSYRAPASSPSSATASESAPAPSMWAPHLLGSAAGPDDTPSPSVESISDEEPPTMTLPITPAAQPESPRSTRGNRPVKNGEKKPPLACLFCRGRKIACGPPVPDGDDHTCNQCHRRGLKCEYPAESRRGMRRKRSSSDLDGDARDFKRSSSKSQRRA